MRRTTVKLLLAGSCVGMTAHAVTAASLSATWTGAAGNWTTAANWSSNPQFPSNGGGNTWAATVVNPAAAIALDTPIAINRFLLFDGRLNTSSNALSLADHLQWDGGEVVGAGTINVSNTIALDGGTKRISAVTINAAATCTTSWLGGTMDQTDVEGGVFNNAGTFNDLTDDSWVWLAQRTPVFNNVGTYNKFIGAALSVKQVQAQFNNSGTVNITAGDLWLSGGGESTGTFNVAAGTRLIFSDFAEHFADAGAINTTLQTTSRVNAAGEVLFSNLFGNAISHIHGTFDAALLTVDPGILGEVRFHPNSSLNPNFGGGLDVRSGRLMLNTLQTGGVVFDSLAMSGGQIEGADELLIIGGMTWTGGTVRGTGQTFEVFGGLTISGPADKFIIRRAFHADGNATSSGGTLWLESADVRNGAGSTWTVTGEMDFVDAGGLFFSRFFNDGTLVKGTAGSVTSLAEVQFNNSGTVIVAAGVLAAGGGGFSGGTFQISSAGELRFEGDRQHFLDTTARVAGSAGSVLALVQTAQTLSNASIDVDRVEVRDNASLISHGSLRASATRVSDDSVLLYAAGTFETGTLTVGDGAKVSTATGGNQTIKATALDMQSPTLSRIDLFDDRMILDYPGTSPIASIRPLILIGYNGGNWLGNGITSTTAQSQAGGSTKTGIGYVEAGEIFATFPAAFGGYAVDATSVLIAYTLLGDATLDRTVNIADFARLGANFNTAGLWFNGDFNYDGSINIGDFALLASNFNKSIAGEVPVALSASLPEPALIVPGALSLIGFRRRRRG